MGKLKTVSPKNVIPVKSIRESPKNCNTIFKSKNNAADLLSKKLAEIEQKYVVPTTYGTETEQNFIYSITTGERIVASGLDVDLNHQMENIREFLKKHQLKEDMHKIKIKDIIYKDVAKTVENSIKKDPNFAYGSVANGDTYLAPITRTRNLDESTGEYSAILLTFVSANMLLIFIRSDLNKTV